MDHVRLRAAWDTVRLHETLTHAYENTAFYRALWQRAGVSPADFTDRAALERFPPIRKADIAGNPKALVSRTDAPEAIRDTSGTTGVRLPIYINSAEDEALAELRAGRSVGHPTAALALRILPPPRRLKPVTRSINVGGGGSLVMHLQPGYDQNVWYDAVDMLISVLCEEYFTPAGTARVDVIHTTPPPLFEYATQHMERRGVNPAEFAVKEVMLSGGPLSQSSRSYLGQAWGAAVATSYSCTEVRGEALECARDPRVYHPSPCMLAEVLDFETGRPVADGEIGEVALTGLYPFQRVMPMVRYYPGDMARFHAAPCACGSAAVGLELLGRAQDRLEIDSVAGARVRLGAHAVFEAIAPFPQIPHFPFPRAWFALETATGGHTVRVSVEATDPRSFDRTAIEAGIGERLVAADPGLRALVAAGEATLAVTLVPKNTLTSFFRIYPGR